MKRKIKLWGIFLLGMVAGFIVCAHWNSARYVVQDISPFYNSSVNQGIHQLGQGLKESGMKIKNRIIQ